MTIIDSARVISTGWGMSKKSLGKHAPIKRAANRKDCVACGVLVAESTMDRLVMQSCLRSQPSATLAFFVQNPVNRMIFYASRHMCLHTIRRFLAHICAFVNIKDDFYRQINLRFKEPRF
nr:hypothetical protein [uncultured Cohaesibacter sp.]